MREILNNTTEDEASLSQSDYVHVDKKSEIEPEKSDSPPINVKFEKEQNY